jgi:hypothetical protein
MPSYFSTAGTGESDNGTEDSDDLSMSSSSTDDTMDRFMSSYFSTAGTGESGNGTGDSDDISDSDNRQKRKRNSNRFQNQFGDYLDCNYYRKFLCPDIRDVVYEKSQDRKSVFHSRFIVPLKTTDDLTNAMELARNLVTAGE